MKKTICDKCAGTGEAINQSKTSIAARRARYDAGLLLQDVAARMKISESYLCDLEHQRRAWNTRLLADHRKALLALTK